MDGTGRIRQNCGVFLPISDDDRHLMHPAWVTIIFVVANVALFLYQVMGLISRMTLKAEPPSVFGRIERRDPHVRRMW